MESKQVIDRMDEFIDILSETSREVLERFNGLIEKVKSLKYKLGVLEDGRD